ncbi:aspartate kinase [Tilletiaria anomala UBC 951]|uniref:aspartate kinase n=1 Tax=Tilletiaria anomala (strain ATCC 24038 / CBS 436.72 / UBC 951) TaxID=1037660 RepID=A0A066VSD0_TILAU|nr:aspartate kinase [Tilletiaria anomala UBC 951]KDN43193.1 aspartate kinase [Tilletiaria anomala UBC 951]
MPPTTHIPSGPDIVCPAFAVGSASVAHMNGNSVPDPLERHTKWIVQKYGGTSVGKFLSTIASVIAPHYLQTHKVAIVCSARSGQTKALGTTNLLLKAAKEALEGGQQTPAASTPGGGGSVALRSGGAGGSLSSSLASLSADSSAAAGGAANRLPSASAFFRTSGSNSDSSPLRGTEQQSSLSRTSSFHKSLNGKLSALSVSHTPDRGRSSSPPSTETPPSPPVTGFHATVDRIYSDHIAAARSVVTKDRELLALLEQEIEEDCDRLRDFLLAAKIIEEISPRSQDIIMGIGERLSCRIVVGALRDAGVNAELIGLENIVDQPFLDSIGASPDVAGRGASAGSSGSTEVYLDQRFYDALAEKLGAVLQQCDGVPVVTGYFGNVPGSLLQQIGRGYTDLCAALCAVGLRAQELQIWKEVDGVFTADPRKVPTARLIPAITPEEAAELTYYGSEVIHPFTMEQAIKNAVPIRIKNVENPEGQGTVIFPDREGDVGSEHVVDGKIEQPRTPGGKSGTNIPWGAGSGLLTPGFAADEDLAGKQRKLPTAVTIKDDIIVLNVHSNRKTISHGFFARIFTILDRYGVVVDLISTSEVHVSMAMNGSFRRGQLERIKDELSAVGSVSILHDMVIVSLVGKQMRNMVGVAGKMFTTLAEGNVNIEMISQGANEINISCVVHKRSALKAINLIHYSVLEVSPKPVNAQSGNFGSSFF